MNKIFCSVTFKGKSCLFLTRNKKSRKSQSKYIETTFIAKLKDIERAQCLKIVFIQTGSTSDVLQIENDYS